LPGFQLRNPYIDGGEHLGALINAIRQSQFLRYVHTFSIRPRRGINPAGGILLGMELIFEVRDAEEGGYCARALGYSIFTEAETWDELRANVLEAISVHFENASVFPRLAQLHYVKDELIPVHAA